MDLGDQIKATQFQNVGPFGPLLEHCVSYYESLGIMLSFVEKLNTWVKKSSHESYKSISWSPGGNNTEVDMVDNAQMEMFVNLTDFDKSNQTYLGKQTQKDIFVNKQ